MFLVMKLHASLYIGFESTFMYCSVCMFGKYLCNYHFYVNSVVCKINYFIVTTNCGACASHKSTIIINVYVVLEFKFDTVVKSIFATVVAILVY